MSFTNNHKDFLDTCHLQGPKRIPRGAKHSPDFTDLSEDETCTPQHMGHESRAAHHIPAGTPGSLWETGPGAHYVPLPGKAASYLHVGLYFCNFASADPTIPTASLQQEVPFLLLSSHLSPSIEGGSSVRVLELVLGLTLHCLHLFNKGSRVALTGFRGAGSPFLSHLFPPSPSSLPGPNPSSSPPISLRREEDQRRSKTL